jgi:hypothetical protein
MKAILVCVTLILVSVKLHAQGTLVFSNRPAWVGGTAAENAVRRAGDGVRLAGADWAAQLYWAPGPGAPESSLTPVGSPVNFTTGGAAGFVGPVVVVMPGAPPGSTVTVQMRAWNISAGLTYEIALATLGGWTGYSYPINVNHLGGPDPGGGPDWPPAPLVGLRGFYVYIPIPEPTSLALGVLGAAILLLSRCKSCAISAETAGETERRSRPAPKPDCAQAD